MNFIRCVPLSRRLAFGFLLLVLIMGALGFWSYQSAREIAVNGPVFKRLIMGKELDADLTSPALYIVESQLLCLDLAASTDEAEQDRVIARLSKLKAKYLRAHAYWQEQPVDSRVAEVLLSQAHLPAQEFYKVAYADLIPAVRSQNPAAIRSALAALKSAFEAHRTVIDQVLLTRAEIERATLEWSLAKIRSIGLRATAALLTALLLLLLLGVMLRNSITRPLAQALALANDIAAGNFRMPTDKAFHDEPGQLLSALGTMSQNLQTTVGALQRANYVNDQAMLVSKAGSWSIDLQREPDCVSMSDQTLAILGEEPSADGLYLTALIHAHRLASGEVAVAENALMMERQLLRGEIPRSDVVFAYRRHIDGRIVWIRSVAQITRDAQGRPLELLGMLIDVTEAKRAEDAIALALKQAEEATHSKSEFLATMSHEIRTPMNAIIGLSGLALKNEMPPRIADYLTKIKNSGENLLGIINDILDFSKIESGKMEIEAAPFDLHSIIENLVTLLSEKVEEKGLELLCWVDPDIPKTLVGDALRIGQVLVNMTSNAVKFTDAGEVRVSIAVEQTLGHQVLLKFSIADTGIGLSPEQMGRLFKSFEQADKSITRQYGGTGLGLAISKSLAQAMGGEVGVESTLGQGSVFWFTARLGIGSSERIFVAPSIDLRGRRVLVVDDNAASAMLMCDTLNSLDFYVQNALNGQAALRMVLEASQTDAPYDFVLMDWLMPGMDGLQTIAAMRELPIENPPFVLMVTAHRRQELIKQADLLGVECVLSKPVSSSHLVDAMMLVMGFTSAESVVKADPKSRTELESELDRIGGARVLLVEDNEINQQVALELLQGAGMNVDLASNGQMAVHQVQARFAQDLPYDIVLMDMQMPVMDGVSAARVLRQDFDASALPIVAMTANAMKVDRERCMGAGMNDFVTKPIAPAHLWGALLKWVKPRPGIGAAFKVRANEHAGDPGEGLGVLLQLQRSKALDVELGLSRTNNNPALYLELLRKFATTQAHSPQAIRQAIAHADLATAQRLAHTLRGVAGNLGATRVQSCAEQLESALRGDTPDEALDTFQEQTEQALGQLLQKLKASPGFVKEEQAVSREVSAAERVQAAAILQTLLHKLKQDEPDAKDLWDKHAALLRQVCPQAARIESAIENYEFEEAAQLIVNATESDSTGS